MADIAVLGYGNVGSGVVELLERSVERITMRSGEQIRVKRVYQSQPFPDSPHREYMTDGISEILHDPDIKIVVETIGGDGLAYDLTRQLLRSGRHVVTSNKALIASHGAELLALAASRQVQYRFEASMGGGLPIIQPLQQILATNDLIRITGVLSGPANELLARMHEGKTFQAALQDVKIKGDAEHDLSDSIDGHDSAEKLAILSTLAYGGILPADEIHTEGVGDMVLSDIQAVKAVGGAIGLLAESFCEGNQVVARVGPAVLYPDSPLASVGHVSHAVLVTGEGIGKALFFGCETTNGSTASAIVADVVDIVRNQEFYSRHHWDHTRTFHPVLWMDDSAEMLVRIQTGERMEKVQHTVKTFFPEANPMTFDSEMPGNLVFMTGEGKEESHRKKLARLNQQLRLSDTDPGYSGQRGVQRVLRIWKR